MEVSAWNNGEHHVKGAGYGLRIHAKDRDTYFERSWKIVYVSLPGEEKEVEVNVDKSSFWNDTCRELINKQFGQWLIKKRYAPWQPGAPPKFRLLHNNGNHFRLEML